MHDMVQQILNITLFAGAGQSLALTYEGVIDSPQSLLPDTCHLDMASNSPTPFLTALWNLLDSHQTECLFLLPPFIPAEALPQQIKTQHPDLDLPDIALNLALEKTSAGCRLGLLMPADFCSIRAA